MLRSRRLSLSVLAVLALSTPVMADESPATAVTAQLVAEARAAPAQPPALVQVATTPTPAPGQVVEPLTSATSMTPEEVAQLAGLALTSKNWALLGVLAALLLTWLARTLGAKVLPFLGTDAGGVVLALVTGALVTLAGALSSGQTLSLGLMLSSVLTAASASGLWSWGRKVRQAAAPDYCRPEEYASGKCS